MNDISGKVDDLASREEPTRLYPRPSSLAWNFVIALSAIPLGLFIYSLLGRYYFFAELVCNFRCQIMFMLLPFALLLLGRRTWFSLIVMAAMLWSMIGIVSIFLPGDQPESGPDQIRIMSFNVLGENENHADAIQQIIDVDPDVLIVAEYSRNWHVAMTLLNDRYPYQINEPRWHGFGLAVFSKKKFTDHKVYQLSRDKTDVPFIVANFDIEGRPLRLAALHTISPTNRYRLTLRNDQFVETAEILCQEELPTVVMGDFNCTPWSSFLSDFAKKTGYRDSRQGFGYHASWPEAKKWPMKIPIDHAYVSEDIYVHDRWLGEYSGSDHLPVVIDISISQSSN